LREFVFEQHSLHNGLPSINRYLHVPIGPQQLMYVDTAGDTMQAIPISMPCATTVIVNFLQLFKIHSGLGISSYLLLSLEIPRPENNAAATFYRVGLFF
jgi:hypothetical protein